MAVPCRTEEELTWKKEVLEGLGCLAQESPCLGSGKSCSSQSKHVSRYYGETRSSVQVGLHPVKEQNSTCKKICNYTTVHLCNSTFIQNVATVRSTRSMPRIESSWLAPLLPSVIYSLQVGNSLFHLRISQFLERPRILCKFYCTDCDLTWLSSHVNE